MNYLFLAIIILTVPTLQNEGELQDNNNSFHIGDTTLENNCLFDIENMEMVFYDSALLVCSEEKCEEPKNIDVDKHTIENNISQTPPQLSENTNDVSVYECTSDIRSIKRVEETECSVPSK